MKRFLAIAALAFSLFVYATQGFVAGSLFGTLCAALLMPKSARGYAHAAGTYTLLDLALRNSKGVSSLIEGVLTYSPELSSLPVYPRSGITYATLTRTGLPSGDFRAVGQGSHLNKSEWRKDEGSMCLFEAQMRVPEDIVEVAKAQNPELLTGDILADEAMATMRGSVIKIGAQFWYGNKISVSGFAGLSTQVDTANNQVDAGGSGGADSNSVYLVMLDNNPTNPQGLHFLLGANGKMTFKATWGFQQVVDPNDTTRFFNAYTNNFLSYLGLVVPRKEIVYRVKNVINAANPFTDTLGAQLISMVPQALMVDKSQWRWFMNTNARFGLQKSRATVNVATPGNKGVAAGGVFPDVPESCMGIPIVCTDSLLTSERAGLHQ